ncbi:ACN9-domain-containing protein [Hanseniaspora valbyensis NRRL Y-1626]|uniref:Succinate dehydrogenase assembly factor 3 n=1 Tax=Hanseniaspora valbyensis NRRL Y-1626 TaxID=766949 RepID=A0A1B7TCD7_9ASCO|nr:ACN9-domain-containing protein [Hanseniaspora valbyensis NRRL Y-1626]
MKPNSVLNCRLIQRNNPSKLIFSRFINQNSKTYYTLQRQLKIEREEQEYLKQIEQDEEMNTRPLVHPLKLYRDILRQHNKQFKHSNPMIKKLGDEYVKLEFKRHSVIDNPLHIVGFITKWQDYLFSISNGEWKNGTLSEDMLSKMSKEQVGQLYELMKASKEI